MAFLYNTSLSQLKPARKILTQASGFWTYSKPKYSPDGAFFVGSAPVGASNGISVLNTMLINGVDNHAFFNYFYYNSR
jgi:hypothetical protein